MNQQEIEARGLRIEQFGKGWRVFGIGVDLLAVNLRAITDRDVQRVIEAAEFAMSDFEQRQGDA